MLTTGFLSMWISNTATAAMILPIAHAVLQEIGGNKKPDHDSNEETHMQKLNSDECLEDTAAGESATVSLTSATVELSPKLDSDRTVETNNDIYMDDDMDSGSELTDVSNNISRDDTYNTFGDNGKQKVKKRVRFQLPKQSYSDEKLQNDKSLKKLSKGLMLGVAYAANIGGTATLTGTGPNLVLKGDVAKYVWMYFYCLPLFHACCHVRCFPDSPNLVNFGNWFVYGVPQMLLILLFAWVYLSLVFCSNRYEQNYNYYMHLC